VASRVVFFITIQIIVTTAYCQYIVGARGLSMGSSSSTLKDAWAVFHNPAGMAESDKLALGVSLKNIMGIQAMQSVAFAYTQPIGAFRSGLGFFRFGDGEFNRQRWNLSLAHNLNNIYLGGGLVMTQVHINEVTTDRVFSVELGGIADIIPGWSIGVYLFNVNQARLNDQSHLPTQVKIGVSYLGIEDLIMSGEIIKTRYPIPNIRMGIEYKLMQWLPLRFGYNGTNSDLSFGCGLIRYGLQLSYAYLFTDLPGMSQEFTLTYNPG
jgi:hypothetical protein